MWQSVAHTYSARVSHARPLRPAGPPNEQLHPTHVVRPSLQPAVQGAPCFVFLASEWLVLYWSGGAEAICVQACPGAPGKAHTTRLGPSLQGVCGRVCGGWGGGHALN